MVDGALSETREMAVKESIACVDEGRGWLFGGGRVTREVSWGKEGEQLLVYNRWATGLKIRFLDNCWVECKLGTRLRSGALFPIVLPSN